MVTHQDVVVILWMKIEIYETVTVINLIKNKVREGQFAEVTKLTQKHLFPFYSRKM